VSCRDYASAEFIPAHDEGKFDYVAVDGRSRMLCLKRALKLIKPEVLQPHHSEWPALFYDMAAPDRCLACCHRRNMLWSILLIIAV
jgi:hypothetical protein